MSSRAHRSARHGRRSRRGLRIPVIAAGVATVAALGAAWAGTQTLRSPGSTAASTAASAAASAEARSRTELAPGTVFVPAADPSSAPATPSASAPAPASPAVARGSAAASPSPAGSKPGSAAEAAPAAKPKPAASAPKTTAKAAFAPGYDSAADGRQALDAALRAAAADGKQVLLDFGANWCGNCKAADKVFGQPATNALLNDSYHLVKIDIGSQNSVNFSILRKYSSGGGSYKMPVLIVLSPPGTVRTDTHQSGNPALTADGLGSFLRQWS
ncbi:thioredoxin family protein [Streptomyces goshikiensis]|uniref:thioredoxin family protein n=1 Tax=Streptomyces goshikiensis TaxID=1942 RepID=UPI00332CA789